MAAVKQCEICLKDSKWCDCYGDIVKAMFEKHSDKYLKRND